LPQFVEGVDAQDFHCKLRLAERTIGEALCRPLGQRAETLLQNRENNLSGALFVALFTPLPDDRTQNFIVHDVKSGQHSVLLLLDCFGEPSRSGQYQKFPHRVLAATVLHAIYPPGDATVG
jgi:hypothetical protein